MKKLLKLRGLKKIMNGISRKYGGKHLMVSKVNLNLKVNVKIFQKKTLKIILKTAKV